MGLRPDEVYEMTMREFEVYSEGYAIRWDRALEVLAWVQANLINVHIPKGKPRITVDGLLPRGARSRRGSQTAVDAPATMDEAKERARKALAEKEQAEFESSERGKKMSKVRARLGLEVADGD